ncbi:MAG: lysophospholipase [Thermoplasmata archaeon]
MVTYENGFLQLDTGINVFYRFWKSGESKRNIIGIHGFADHSGRYAEFSRYLAENGYSVVMYDLRGHGKTARENDVGYIKNFNYFIDDTKSFVRIMKEKLNTDRFFLYGHSMGGLIALKYASMYGDDIDGLISSGPALIMNTGKINRALLIAMARVSPGSRIKLPINPEYLTHDKPIWKAYISDQLVFKKPTLNLLFEMYKSSKSIWKNLHKIDSPILMLHGGEDKIVPVEATEEAYRIISSKDKSKKIYKGMFHEIHNEIDKITVYDDISDWLRRH